MRIIDIREKTFSISRYADPEIPSGDLTTSAVVIVTDVLRAGKPVVGFGFSSLGRYAQGGLIRERFAPRLLAAREEELSTPSGDNLDPLRAWSCMMKNEKPGGHGERCVAVGTLDMALWDAAAKIAQKPLYRLLSAQLGVEPAQNQVPVYAGGGYYYPTDDIHHLTDEIRQFLDHGYTRFKIKIGGQNLAQDLHRIEAVLKLLPGGEALAVDAMNRYTPEAAIQVAAGLAPYRLMWFEDICDPLDFETHRQIAAEYAPPLAAGEALFSLPDTRNLVRYSGLRPDRDVLVFDPAHCYGLPEYLRMLEWLAASGWAHKACQPHGGHLFSLQVAAGLRLGGSESSPFNFQPFGGFGDTAEIKNGAIQLPDVPGIGFETRAALSQLFQSF